MKEDYPNAAYRHLEDSRILLASRRWDGSTYLAGYVIECSIKAVAGPQSWSGDGHDISKLLSLLEHMAASRAAGIKRNISSQLFTAIRDALVRDPNWHPRMRYASSGLVTEKGAKQWWNLAERTFGMMAKRSLSGGAL